MFMASDDVQQNGEHCLREGKRCEPEVKNLSSWTSNSKTLELLFSVCLFDIMDKELHQGLIIVTASIIFYSLVYLWTFRSHLLEATESQKNQIANAQNHNTDTVPKQDTHSPQNCYEYASCTVSMINVTILSVAVPIAFLYRRYWEDSLYETPGITFYAICSALGYFMFDVVAGILVHFRYSIISNVLCRIWWIFQKVLFWSSYVFGTAIWYVQKRVWIDCIHVRCSLSRYQTISIPWNVVLHHLFGIGSILWLEVALPHYVWTQWAMVITSEWSTLFLDDSFFADLNKVSDAVFSRLKSGFLISLCLMRVPVSFILYPGFAIKFGAEMHAEFPLDQFIGVMAICTFPVVMQGIWTVLIVKKTYRAMTSKKDVATLWDYFDLTDQNKKAVQDEQNTNQTVNV